MWITDGQTIHLVPRPEPPGVAVTPERSQVEPPDASDASMQLERGIGRGCRSLRLLPLYWPHFWVLAMLTMRIRIKTCQSVNSSRDCDAARIRNRSRRPNHRLTQFDLEVPDPGSMEHPSVRD
jgi:hypothetical protein